MDLFVQNLIYYSGEVTGFICEIFTDVLRGGMSIFGGIGVGIAFSLAAGGGITAEVIAGVRRWHGKIDDKYANISNVADSLAEHSTQWKAPLEVVEQLARDRDRLGALIIKCRSNTGSSADRTVRNTLLKGLVKQCTTRIKTWATAQFYEGIMTADEVHLLGFLLPGDTGGRRERREPTDELTEVKVSVINSDFIRVVIDRADVESAARVRRGWPEGVQTALIVILADDGVTEVLRRMTTHLHTDIRMPAGSRGRQFIIKAAFLSHVDDAPKFGNEPTFFMPLSTEDLAANRRRPPHPQDEA